MLKASYSALYFTTFESAQEMVWRVTALKSFEGSKAEFGWNHGEILQSSSLCRDGGFLIL